jgi:hypothetical protein
VIHSGIVDFSRLAEAVASEVTRLGGVILTGHPVIGLTAAAGSVSVRTGHDEFTAGRVLTCAGLQSDRVAMLSGAPQEPSIVPFRGDYWQLPPERRHLARNLIYPVPDPKFPFLGVYFTRRIRDDAVWLGPNAVLATAREGYRRSADRRHLPAYASKIVSTSISVAEVVKLTDNSWHALKITFANEIGCFCSTCSGPHPRHSAMVAAALLGTRGAGGGGAVKHAPRRAAHIDCQSIPDMWVTYRDEEVDPVEAGEHPVADGGLIEVGNSQPGPQDPVGQQACGEGRGVAGAFVVGVPEPLLVVRAGLADHQHRARPARSGVPGGAAEREPINGRLVRRERRLLMRRRKCLEPDRARPALDPSPVGGVAETGEECLRVGQHAAIMPRTRHHRGNRPELACPEASPREPITVMVCLVRLGSRGHYHALPSAGVTERCRLLHRPPSGPTTRAPAHRPDRAGRRHLYHQRGHRALVRLVGPRHACRVSAIVMLDRPGTTPSRARLARQNRAPFPVISLGTPLSGYRCPAPVPRVKLIFFNPRPTATRGWAGGASQSVPSPGRGEAEPISGGPGYLLHDP